MAVAVKPLATRVQVLFDLGTENGKKVTRGKSFSNIKFDAEDQDIYDVMNELASLQDYPVDKIRRFNQSELENSAE